MTLSKNAEKKIIKKIKRCQQIIFRETGLEFSGPPTENVIVCNAGIATGLRQEVLVDAVLRYGVSLKDVELPAGKSYCYLRFYSSQMAQAALTAMNGKAPLGQDDCVLLMAYCLKPPTTKSRDAQLCTRGLPPGLILLPDFIDEKLELELIQIIDSNDEKELEGNLKHRRVKHFGYEFLYGSNNVDKSKPLEQSIPLVCNQLWDKLQKSHPELGWHVPDQLTVNRYEPGQGIPPHVDTHSAFQDPIISLSLGADISMDFRDTKGNHLTVDLPPRSLLIMSGESRYGWTHGITPRKMDVVQMNNSLTVRKRGLRTSFTFRKLRDEPCQCQFHSLCDSYKKRCEIRSKHLRENAAKLELENVHKVYNEIAKHFSETRHSPWPRVETFLRSLPTGSVLIDIGCGNGKYLALNPQSAALGCDRSDELLKVCTGRGLNVLQCDCLALPFRSASADACICIAVIHHLATEERRRQAISEMARVLRPGGRALVYVWAKNQEANAKKSSYLRQNKHNNKPSGSEGDSPQETIPAVNYLLDSMLPIHTNRTQFQHQDLLVPWKLRNEEQEKKATFLRYYHVFEKHELDDLCRAVEGISIEESYYDQGNWCVVFRTKE
ncbi:alkylated DNA repair protein alkB homolog 8 [Topomyia yanbarensis]|uniref:alkylated DNA repair protein alkB homolog 8 n=1 Tax=Topomyia yanbarensis TaxID=2498891 RepID=UPI00273B0691|nr:alkylated DNA repair protein alkB homolog 8 [Topomyia yanbarensis]